MSIYEWKLVWYQSRKGQVKIIKTMSEFQINPAGGKRAHKQWSKYNTNAMKQQQCCRGFTKYYTSAMKQRPSCRGFTYYSIYECNEATVVLQTLCILLFTSAMKQHHVAEALHNIVFTSAMKQRQCCWGYI